MGTSASLLAADSETEQFHIFKELKAMYDTDLNPKILEGILDEEDAFRSLQSKYNALLKEKMESNLRPEVRELIKFLNVLETSDNPYQRSRTMPCGPYDIEVGDIVKARVECLYFEGIVVEAGDEILSIDFGDSVEPIKRTDCYLVLHSADIEIGDTVEVRSEALHIYYVGVVSSFNMSGTVNISTSAEDDTCEIELDVTMSNLRKIGTNRTLCSENQKLVFDKRDVQEFRRNYSFKPSGEVSRAMSIVEFGQSVESDQIVKSDRCDARRDQVSEEFSS